MDKFRKEIAHFRSDFRQQLDTKVDHILEMIASIQEQLQMQELTKERGYGDDFQALESSSISEKTDTFVHESDFLTKETTKVEEHKLLDEMSAPEIKVVDVSEIGEMKLEIEIEENEVTEQFVEVLNDAPIITTVSKSRFEETKFEVWGDLQFEESNSKFEVLRKQPIDVSLRSAAREPSKNSDARKVFGELTMRELNPLQAITVFVDLGKVIYIYKKENNVKNEATSASCIVGFEMEDIESIMGFDPGGDYRVFGECSYKKLFYIEELVLLLSCLNSPRNHSKSYKPKYFVEEVILGFDVTYLHRSWLRVKATRRPHERNTRLENMCRRIWNLAWRKKQLGAEESQRKKKWHLERERGWREAVANISNIYDGEKGDVPGEIIFHSENNRDRLSKINSVETMEARANKKMGEKLCIIFISLHGLIRGENLELRSDSDIGGLVKYVVELARALGSMPGVYRVDLLTRQVSSPEVDWSYGEPRELLPPRNFESLGDEMGENSSAHIVRIPLGPKDKFIPKELLWSHIHEFVDGVLNHIIQKSKVLGEQIGNGHPVWPVAIHGHYADAGKIGSLFSGALNVPMLCIGHSLDSDKLEKILRQGQQLRDEINSTYKIATEELLPDASEVVITSTSQKIEESNDRSSYFQRNDKRHRYQNLVHGISIQMLGKLSFVIRSTCETIFLLFEDNHFDIFSSNEWWKDDLVSWTVLLKEYIIDENRDIMKSLLEGMLETLRYTNNFNVMIEEYVKLGDMRLAKRLFDRMPDWKLYSWNLMLVEYCQNKQSHEVIELLEQLSVSKMLELNGITIVVVVPTLTDFGDLIYRYVKEKNLDKYVEVLLLIVVGVMNVRSNVSTGKKGIAVSMFDQLLSKPQPQFRHLSRGDTTLSRGEHCCGNGARLEGRVGGFDGGKGRRWCDSEVAIQDWIDYGESGGSDVCGSGHVMRLGFGILPTSFKSQDGAKILSCVHDFKELKSRKSHVMGQSHIFGDISVKIDNIRHYVHVALGIHIWFWCLSRIYWLELMLKPLDVLWLDTMIDQPSQKPPFLFRHLSRGDTILRGASIVVRMEHGKRRSWW